MFCSTVRVGNRVIHGRPAAKVFKVIGFILLGIIGVTALDHADCYKSCKSFFL